MSQTYHTKTLELADAYRAACADITKAREVYNAKRATAWNEDRHLEAKACHAAMQRASNARQALLAHVSGSTPETP